MTNQLRFIEAKLHIFGDMLAYLSRLVPAELLEDYSYLCSRRSDAKVYSFTVFYIDVTNITPLVCNRTATARKAVFDLSALGRQFSSAEQTRLIADDPMVMNTLTDPNAVKVFKKNVKAPIRKGHCTIDAPAWSFTELILE